MKKYSKNEILGGYEAILTFIDDSLNSIIDLPVLKSSKYWEAINFLDALILADINISYNDIDKNNYKKYQNKLEELIQKEIQFEIVGDDALNKLTSYSPYNNQEKDDQTMLDNERLKNFSISEIFSFTPFDRVNNLNNRISEHVFYDKLFVKHLILEENQRKLENIINDSYDNHRVILLHGFSGIGKTTFLNYFKKTNSQYNHDYFNCENYINIESKSESESFVNTIFQQRFYEFNDQLLSNTFKYLLANKFSLYKFLPDFFRRFESALIKSKDDQNFNDLIFSLNKFEVAIFYFLVKFYEKISKNEEDKIEIFYFDNLDVYNEKQIESFIYEFIPRLISSLSNIVFSSHLVFSNIDLAQTFKFIICTRNRNLTSVDSHLYDRLSMSFKTLEISPNNSPKIYQSIIGNRLNLINEIFENKIYTKSLFRVIEKGNNLNIVSGVFNYNYRRIISFLVKNVQTLNRIEEVSSPLIFRSVIISLLSKDLEEYIGFSRYNIDRGITDKGFFNLERYILTALVNLSITREKENLHPIKTRSITSIPLIEVLQFFEDSNFLENRIILRHLLHLIKGSNYSGSKLISLSKVNRIETEKIFEELIFMDLSKIRNNTLPSKFVDIEINIWPATYNYTNTICHHFEFYAHILNISSSLPVGILDRADDEDSQLKFIEKTISKVFSHLKSEGRIQNRIYQESKDNLISYNIAHTYTLVNNRSYSHVSRAIFSHITYLDRIRTDLKLPVSIRTYLSSSIEKYVDLLGTIHLSENEKKIIDALNQQIALIKNSPANESLHLTIDMMP